MLECSGCHERRPDVKNSVHHMPLCNDCLTDHAWDYIRDLDVKELLSLAAGVFELIESRSSDVWNAINRELMKLSDKSGS